jgi:ABC-2 type transport system ATP-binding protein
MIALTNLQKVIAQATVINIGGLTVHPGETAAIVGPAGSGKHALMDLLTGRTRPTVGTVRLAGIDPAAERETFSRRVGVLFEHDGLYENRPPRGNLLFQCRLYGLPDSRADEVLSRVGLADHARVRLKKLPSGLARRLAFGRAILHGPEALILFDPFARCDEASITLIGDLMRELAGGGAALLVLAHDTTHLGTLCDRMLALDQGRIADMAGPAEDRQSALPFKIAARLEGKVVLVNPGDILFAAAEGGSAVLVTSGGRLPTQYTLNELEERLARSGFFRAHRGYLVNLQHIREIIPFTRDSFSLRLDDPDSTEIPLSKMAASELRDMFGY